MADCFMPSPMEGSTSPRVLTKRGTAIYARAYIFSPKRQKAIGDSQCPEPAQGLAQ